MNTIKSGEIDNGRAVYLRVMNVGNVVRVTVVLAAIAAAAGSASSTSSGSQGQAAGPNGQGGAYGQGQPGQGQPGQGQPGQGDAYGQAPGGADQGPPPAQQMEPDRALGLWRSTFGAVKIEPDTSKGGLAAGSVQGIWLYQRQGQDVVGYFSGNLRGNVLQFRWQEPSDPTAPLAGEGFLVFDPKGRQYTGRWWSDHRDRVGDWNGWRQTGARTAPVNNAAPEPDATQPPAPAPARRTYRTQPVAPTYN